MNTINKLILLGICLFAAGCYYDSADVLYGNAPKAVCDTTNITYSGRIASIINLNCSSCHSATTGPISGSGVVLDDYDNLSLWASLGNLMGDIKGSPGYNQMPQSGNKLSDCDITAIQHWIDLNTPNN